MLINSTTDLNKLKFTSSGGDRWDQGKSGQPYIVEPIPGVNDTFIQQLDLTPQPTGGVDFLLRGGLLSANAALTDVSRLTEMLFSTKSPNGFEFIAKQNILSRNSVKTEASFGVGYAGGGLNQGLYTPVGTLLQTALDPIATGVTNLFGINPSTDNNPLTAGFQPKNNGGVNSYFGTVNMQNLTNDAFDSNRLVNLHDAIQYNTDSKTSGGNIILNPGGDTQNTLLQYGGGPGSILGIGKTNIPFTDQRTGFRNANLLRENPTFINPEGPNRYGGFGISPHPPFIEPSITGITDISLDPSIISKSNLFHKGATTSFLNSGVEEDSPGGFFNLLSELETGYSINLASINDYSRQPPGPLKRYSNNVYISGSLKTDLQVINVNGAASLTQEQLYQRPIASQTGLNNVSDFRIDTSLGDITQLSSSQVLSISPDYTTKNKNIRVNQGDPGLGTNLGVKDVLHYGIAANDLEALDQINALPMYEASAADFDGDDGGKATNDLVKFRIAVINNDKANGLATYIHFRAFIDDFSDNYTSKWDSVKYVGRGEELHNYVGFGREISLGWTVYAQSKAELIPMYKKLNYLASTLSPDYNAAGFMRGNIVRLTVGGYLYEQPGIIKGLTYTVPMESTWEIAIDEEGKPDPSVKELPHMIKVTGVTFVPIQEFIPAKADSLIDPNQKYISLANNTKTTNYSDVYRSYKQQGAVLD